MKLIEQDQRLFENELNRRMPNGTYGGVRGKETKVGQKTFVSRPARFVLAVVADQAAMIALLRLRYL